MRLLLVEDNAGLSEGITAALMRAGFAVDAAGRAEEADELFGLSEYDLVILDIGLPDGDGLTLLKRWRRSKAPPVILLTARDTLDDRIAGLDSGADDYVVKPVEIAELVARIRAVLRRPGGRVSTVLRAGPLTLDTGAREVKLSGEHLTLSRRETGVLEQLMRHVGRVVTRRSLEDSAYALDDEVSPNAIEAAVSRLRRRLEAAGCPIPIITVRGVGWMLALTETGA